MGFDYSAIVTGRFGAGASTCNILVAALLAVTAVGFNGSASGAGQTFIPPTFRLQSAKAPSALSQSERHVLIQLTGQPAAAAYAAALTSSGASTQSNNSVAASAGRNQIQTNRTQQAALVSAMQAAGIQYKEIYRVQRALNGVAVIVPSSEVAALSKLPGVKSVKPLIRSVPTSNSSAAYVGAPQVWGGVPGGQADGSGIKIGIIDTGVDYQHANFGGSGLLSDYQANDRVTLSGITFPTPKVAGGTDLAGDAYDAGAAPGDPALIPQPDPNPTDCYGHGSHVAGIAAGYGVASDGSTFAGPYDPSVPTTLRIQPGIAPKAKLYSIKIFGCAGSTELTVPGIDWALDPNQDGDLSDHLDVINMSLGADNGGLSALDTEASNNAVLAGMIVVASAGNAGDTYMVVGDPSIAARALSVAASVDSGETLFLLNVTAPAAIAGSYNTVPGDFGPPIPPAVISGNLAYGTPHNGCDAVGTTPLPITGVSGMVAVIDRGACSFQIKVYNAQLGGATGVIVVNNAPGPAVGMAGDATVPAVNIAASMVSQADGGLIKAQLLMPSPPTVTGSVVPGASLGDTLASFSSRGPVNGAPTALKPDISAPGLNIVSTQTGMTCVIGGSCITPTASGLDPGNLSLSISGTSMAAPQVAGEMALLRQLHPDLSVEELKAIAMNGSLHDITTLPLGAGFRYGAGRVGAGRIDTVASANLSLAAFSADGSGAVAVTFPSEIDASTSVVQKVRVKNYTATPKTISLAIDTVVDNPGVSFSLPGGSSLTLLGHQTLDIPVQMAAQANLLTHTFDPSISLTQGTIFGTLPRYWQTEETAYLTLNDGAGNQLRVPLYIAPNPTSAMSGGSAVPTGGLGAGSAMINLAGSGVCTGTLAAGPTCNGTFPTDEVSLVTPFELQVSNPRNSDPLTSAEANVRYVGVSVDQVNGLINFGVALWGPAGVPVAEETTRTRITVLTADGLTTLGTVIPFALNDSTDTDTTNVYLSGILIGPDIFGENFANQVDPSFGDTRVFQNDVFFLSVFTADLGLGPTDTFQYFVDTFDLVTGNAIDHLGPFTYNMGAPGLDFTTNATVFGGVLYQDLPGAKIPVDFNAANLTANGSLGALLLHHHNKAGSTAEVLTVPPVTVLAPVLQSAVSRKVHGAAGTFDLPLSAVATDPTTEPRLGPSQTIVFTFDKPIAAATATVTEGTAVAGTPTFSGNDVIVNLTGVNNAQYVTLSLSNVNSVDGATGGTGTVRVGFLAADVNQNRVVSFSDVLLIDAQVAHAVTATNYLKDINANGVIAFSDELIANTHVTSHLPAP